MADKKLSSTFNCPYPAPSVHEGADGKHNLAVVGKPEDTSVLSTVFFQPNVKGSPASLASPMGTSIPDIGHGFKGGK